MTKPISVITGYHAHVYYRGAEKDTAASLREQIGQKFSVKLGNWHDENVGPHKASMYLVSFMPSEFNKLLPWLMLNRNGLSILVHPETGNDLTDHTENAFWLGSKLDLDLNSLKD